jgi:hypothetical protein
MRSFTPFRMTRITGFEIASIEKRFAGELIPLEGIGWGMIFI